MNRSCSQSSNLNQGRGLGAGEAGVKIGGLWKRSQGVSRFTKPNYKHRVFILTEQALSYYQGTIDVSISHKFILVHHTRSYHSQVDVIISISLLHTRSHGCREIIFAFLSLHAHIYDTENRSVEGQSVAGNGACCGVRGRWCFQSRPHIPGK